MKLISVELESVSEAIATMVIARWSNDPVATALGTDLRFHAKAQNKSEDAKKMKLVATGYLASLIKTTSFV